MDSSVPGERFWKEVEGTVRGGPRLEHRQGTSVVAGAAAAPEARQSARGYDPSTLNDAAGLAMSAKALSMAGSVRCPSMSSRKK